MCVCVCVCIFSAGCGAMVMLLQMMQESSGISKNRHFYQKYFNADDEQFILIAEQTSYCYTNLF